MLIGIAIALLMTWLLLIAAVAIRRPRGKKLRLQAAYRRFSSSAALRRRNQRLKVLGDTRCRRQHRLRFGGGYSVAHFGPLHQALPTRANPRYVPRWSQHVSAGGALGGRQVAGFPYTHEDRLVWPVHRRCRVWAAGSLPASHAGSRLRRDVPTVCAGDQGLTTPVRFVGQLTDYDITFHNTATRP